LVRFLHGRKRRLQVVRDVREEVLLHLVEFAQAPHHGVEVPGELCELVPSARLDGQVETPFGQFSRGPGEALERVADRAEGDQQNSRARR
jgi:hypothetical protein